MHRRARVGALICIAANMLACQQSDKSSRTVRQQATRAATVDELLGIADSLYGESAYDSARSMYDRAARQAGAAHDSIFDARALTGLAFVAKQQGRFDEAQSTDERALAIERRLGLQGEIAKSLNHLGLIAQVRGQLAEALRRFADALTAAQAARDSGYIAKVHGNLGLVYSDLGEFDRARREMMIFRDAVVAKGNEVLQGNAFNNLGMLETRLNEPDRAIEWLTVARSHYAKADNVVGLENSLGQMAVAYSQRGEFSRALALLDSALTIATSAGLEESRADDLVLMAELYQNAGDHTHALDLLRRARGLCDSLRMTTKLGHVASVEAGAFMAIGDVSRARTRAREAATLQRAAGNRPGALDAQLLQAELAQAANDSTDAASALAVADSITRDLGWRVARIRYRLSAARVADLAHRPREVIALLGRMTVGNAMLTADEQADMDALRARAFFKSRQYKMAAVAGRRALTGFEHIRQGLGAGSLRASYLGDRATAYSDLVITLLTLGQVDEAFRVADAGRGRALLDRLGAAARGIPAQTSSNSEAMRRLLKRIDELVERLRIRDTVGVRGVGRAAGASDVQLERELLDARRQYEALLDRTARPEALADRGRDGIDMATIRRALAPHEALLEYLSTPEKLVIFVTTRDQLRWIDVPIGRVELGERVHLARELISSRSGIADEPLRGLYNDLIGPVKAAGLLAGVTSLLIVPQAALTYLPFAALRAPSAAERPRYLVNEYDLRLIPSAAAMLALRARADTPMEQSASVFAPLPERLPATSDEVVAVGRRITGARVSVGESANEPALRAALMNSRIVHVASHGVLDSDSPMFSSIEVAAPRDSSLRRQDNDGRLETHEVLSMNVRSWLVFLSGCETALGYSWSNAYSRRDDYATLGQSFLFSGARNVVATLWRIDDRAATEFAQRFYAKLAGSSPSTALAAAQRSFIADARYSAPFYWAGYALSGDGRP